MFDENVPYEGCGNDDDDCEDEEEEDEEEKDEEGGDNAAADVSDDVSACPVDFLTELMEHTDATVVNEPQRKDDETGPDVSTRMMDMLRDLLSSTRIS